MRKKYLLLSTALLSFAFLAHAENKEKTTTPEKPIAEQGEEKAADVTLTIQGDDTMRFNKTAFEITEGQIVKVIFKNAGTMPKEAMGHNLVILKPGTDKATFAMAGITNTKTYLPSDDENKAKIVAATAILGPGEEEVITFSAGKAGEYPYICSFPGHFGIMNGIMTVSAE